MPPVKIYLTGDVGRHEENYRARVSGLGVHAYGATTDEAIASARAGAQIKINNWYVQGVLTERLEHFEVKFDGAELDERGSMPQSKIEMALTPA